jgi:hypothetical protein
MAGVGVIDDRGDLRETLVRRIQAELPKNWECFSTSPLAEMGDYPAWIAENDVAVMLLDERLNEQVECCETFAGYNGHDLVAFLREHMPTFPIFIVTSYKDDEELRKKFRDVEDIIERKEFLRRGEEYVPRFLRSGQKYIEVFESDLSELATRADRIAKGVATREDLDRANAIRMRVGLAFPYEALNDRGEWLKRMNEKIGELEQLKAEIDEFLKDYAGK